MGGTCSTAPMWGSEEHLQECLLLLPYASGIEFRLLGLEASPLLSESCCQPGALSLITFANGLAKICFCFVTFLYVLGLGGWGRGYMCTCVQVQPNVGTCGSRKLTLRVVPWEPHIFSFEAGSHWSGGHRGGQTVRPANPRNPPSLPFQLWGYKCMLPYPVFVVVVFFKHGCCGVGLRPSCLPIKDFTR